MKFIDTDFATIWFIDIFCIYFYKSLHQKSEDIKDRLLRLKEAKDSYHETVKSILVVSRHVYEMLVSSEVEERRMLIKLVLSNLTIKRKKRSSTLRINRLI
ncbi:hypothetical protein KBC04_00155 [Candidatus Babeliales bacterium]|nr:hypothetical protein [Candidatus Babeliales bacterium]MBP9843497.1 hypothetical protein [Candidatus Babeliales bacterium]